MRMSKKIMSECDLQREIFLWLEIYLLAIHYYSNSGDGTLA